MAALKCDKEAAEREAARVKAAAAPMNRRGRKTDENAIEVIPKPKGEAGDKQRGFILRDVMELDTEENKELFEAIQVYMVLSTVTDASITHVYVNLTALC
jgi:hypothetical protein